MSTSDTNINMKSLGDKGISIQNYGGHINLTINNEVEKEVRSKRKRDQSEKDSTQDTEGATGGKRIK